MGSANLAVRGDGDDGVQLRWPQPPQPRTHLVRVRVGVRVRARVRVGVRVRARVGARVGARVSTWKVMGPVLPMRPKEVKLTRRAMKHVPSTRERVYACFGSAASAWCSHRLPG